MLCLMMWFHQSNQVNTAVMALSCCPNSAEDIFILHAVRGQQPRDILLIPALVCSELHTVYICHCRVSTLYVQFGDLYWFRPGK